MERRRVLREYLLEVLLGVERCRVSRDVVEHSMLQALAVRSQE